MVEGQGAVNVHDGNGRLVRANLANDLFILFGVEIQHEAIKALLEIGLGKQGFELTIFVVDQREAEALPFEKHATEAFKIAFDIVGVVTGDEGKV